MPRGVYDRTPKTNDQEIDYGPETTVDAGNDTTPYDPAYGEGAVTQTVPNGDATLAMDQIALQAPAPADDIMDTGTNRQAAVRNMLQDYPGLQIVFDDSGSVTMSFGQKSESINMTGVSDELIKRAAVRVMQPIRNQ